MKNNSDIAAILRISICFFIWLFLLSGVQAQRSSLSNERLRVWENMILKNDVYVSAYVGYGSYSMSSMRKLQNDFIVASGLPAVANSNFPPYWLYGISISQKYDDSLFGFDFESMSTGARSSIADYSGQFISDFKCSGLKLGFFVEKDFPFRLERIKGLRFGCHLEAGGLSSNVNQQTQIVINDLDQGTSTRQLQFKSVAPFLEPTLFTKGEINNKTILQFSIGYMIDIPVDVQISYSLPGYQVSWAGYRIKLGLVRQL